MRLPAYGFYSIGIGRILFWPPRDVEFFAEDWRGCEDGGAKSAEGYRSARGRGAPGTWKLRKMLLEAGSVPENARQERGSRRYT